MRERVKISILRLTLCVIHDGRLSARGDFKTYNTRFYFTLVDSPGISELPATMVIFLNELPIFMISNCILFKIRTCDSNKQIKTLKLVLLTKKLVKSKLVKMQFLPMENVKSQIYRGRI